MTLLKRHPLIAFFVLAYSLSWWPWILYALHLVPTPVFAPGRSRRGTCGDRPQRWQDGHARLLPPTARVAY